MTIAGTLRIDTSKIGKLDALTLHEALRVLADSQRIKVLDVFGRGFGLFCSASRVPGSCLLEMTLPLVSVVEQWGLRLPAVPAEPSGGH